MAHGLISSGYKCPKCDSPIIKIQIGSFVCATEDGVKIFNLTPQLIRHIDASVVGSVALCEVLLSSGLFALVAGGSRPKFPENSVCIWDDRRKKFLLQFIVVTGILSVKLQSSRIFICESKRISVFALRENYAKLFTCDTDNSKGLCAVSSFDSALKKFLIFPAPINGFIEIVDLDGVEKTKTKCSTLIKAHNSDISAISLNRTGTMVATSSVKGTLIRVFDTVNRQKLFELRRGSKYASMHCISFCDESDYLCSSSDTQSVHIFSMQDAIPKKSYILQWVSENRSFATFQVQTHLKNICIFGPNKTLYVISVDGSVYRYTFQEGKGCSLENFHIFRDMEEEEKFYLAEEYL